MMKVRRSAFYLQAKEEAAKAKATSLDRRASAGPKRSSTTATTATGTSAIKARRLAEEEEKRKARLETNYRDPKDRQFSNSNRTLSRLLALKKENTAPLADSSKNGGAGLDDGVNTTAPFIEAKSPDEKKINQEEQEKEDEEDPEREDTYILQLLEATRAGGGDDDSSSLDDKDGGVILAQSPNVTPKAEPLWGRRNEAEEDRPPPLMMELQGGGLSFVSMSQSIVSDEQPQQRRSSSGAEQQPGVPSEEDQDSRKDSQDLSSPLVEEQAPSKSQTHSSRAQGNSSLHAVPNASFPINFDLPQALQHAAETPHGGAGDDSQDASPVTSPNTRAASPDYKSVGDRTKTPDGSTPVPAIDAASIRGEGTAHDEEKKAKIPTPRQRTALPENRYRFAEAVSSAVTYVQTKKSQMPPPPPF